MITASRCCACTLCALFFCCPPAYGQSVPGAFLDGRATLPEIRRWAATQPGGAPRLRALNLDADEDDEVTLEQGREPAGARYLLFKRGRHGYRLVGGLVASALIRLYFPVSGQAYLLTPWRINAQETALKLQQIRAGRLYELGRVRKLVRAGGTERVLAGTNCLDEACEAEDAWASARLGRLMDGSLGERELKRMFHLYGNYRRLGD